MSSPGASRRWTAEEKNVLLSHLLGSFHISTQTAKELSTKMNRTPHQITCTWNNTLKPELCKKLGLEMPKPKPKPRKRSIKDEDEATVDDSSPSPKVLKRIRKFKLENSASASDSDF